MFTITTADDGLPYLEVHDRPDLLLPGVALRPLRPHETAPLLEVFAGLSTASRRMRFLTAVPVLTDPMLERLADVDHDRHGCWVATCAWPASPRSPRSPWRWWTATRGWASAGCSATWSVPPPRPPGSPRCTG